MKIAVIGAGIAGLSIANLLKNKGYDIKVFESCSRPGGLIKCDRINGHLYHLTGGHVFNTKRQDVLDFFWSFFNKEKEFTKAKRNSIVAVNDGLYVPYPIENHMYYFNEEIVYKYINDLIEIAKNRKDTTPKNFEEFLITHFGQTLYDIYFNPYNEKVWRCDLKKVPLSWLEGKLPMPSITEMLFNNIKKIDEEKFVHSSFFYERNGGSQFIADRLSENIDIHYNKKIETINYYSDMWVIEDEQFNKVIFCGNIKQLPSLIFLDKSHTKMINALEYHGTTSVLCEIEDNPYSWIYLPSRKYLSHRIICTGNFATSNRSDEKMSATIEFTDFIEKKEILKNLKEIPFSPQYIAHHYEKYTYPIQGINTRKNILELKAELEAKEIYLCGRFAEWEYSNMDVVMGAAIDLSKRI